MLDLLDVQDINNFKNWAQKDIHHSSLTTNPGSYLNIYIYIYKPLNGFAIKLE